MFSNLASYLLGYGETAPVELPSDNSDDLRLSTVESEEDDWLLVHTARRESTASRGGAVSRSSSTSSLPTCLSMEESWFVTPPPCFTSTGAVTVETSPLENLLIEHPSMSVYDRSGVAVGGVRMALNQPPMQPARARSLSPRPAQAPPQTRHHRAPLQPNYYHNLQLQVFTAQKQQNRKECQMLKGKQLERSNKVRDVNRRNKRQKRSDRQKNHSGANNNRKCC